MDQSFGALLRGYRRSLRLTQEALAQRAGLSVQAVGALERGDRRFPHRDTVTRLADALGLTGQRRADFLSSASSRKGTPGQLAQLDRQLALSAQPAAPVRQLPADIPDFTGRDLQVERLLALLAEHGPDRPPPLVVVVGGPGVGKSTLALHAAHRVADTFADGQLFLDLAGTSEQPREPAGLLAELLHALGVTGAGIPGNVPARATLFRSLLAERRMLLVLDDAAHGDQVRPLLPPNGRSAVIVTGRQLLTDLAGARHIELDVFGEREARDLLAGIVGAQRVAHEPDEAAAILRSCAYLPLAIRIAAGKLVGRPAWPLRLLRERLDDESRRLTELRVGELGVRASFETSVAQLAGDAVRAFRLLGLLGPRTVPGWVLDPLLGRPASDDMVDSLVDASLLRLTRIDVNGRPRYRLHDLLRAYALEGAETIPEPERRDAVCRLLATWLDLTDRAVDRLPPSLFKPPRGRAPRIALPMSTIDRLIAEPGRWFEAEREALIGAVELAVAWRLDEAAWELATAAVPYYDQHGLFEDWRHTHQLALDAARAAGNQRGEAVMLRGLAQVHVYRDEYDAAAAGFRRARELSRLTGDKREQFLASSGLGTIDRVLGRYDRSETHIREALDIMIAEGDLPLEAQLRNALGRVLLAQDKVDEARVSFEESLTLCRRIGDAHREGVVLREASLLYDRIGETNRAFSYLRQALDIFHGIDDERCIAYTMLSIGRVHAGHRDRQRATVALENAIAYFSRNGNRMEEAQCWHLLGELETELQDVASARQHLNRALRLWRSIGATAQSTEVESTLRRLAER